MGRTAATLAALLALPALIASCGGSSEDVAPTPKPVEIGGDPACSVTFRGVVRDIAHDAPMIGATVTVRGESGSATSAPDGRYELAVNEGGGTFVVRAERTGFFADQRAVATQCTGTYDVDLLLHPEAEFTVPQGPPGTPNQQLDKGIVSVEVDNPGQVSGATVALSAPATAVPPGPGMQPGQIPPMPRATVLFLNVQPGTTTVTLTSPDDHCTTDLAADEDHPVHASTTTTVYVRCE